MLQGEHSAIFSTFIKLPFVIKIFALSIFEWPLKTGFTVWLQWKLFILTLFITAIFLTASEVFVQMYQFSLNLSSLQQKFSIMSNYLETNTIFVKWVDCIIIYSKTCQNGHSQKDQKFGFQYQISLNAGQKYCRMLQGEHSAMLSTYIMLPFVIKIFVFSIIEWPLKTGFTV